MTRKRTPEQTAYNAEHCEKNGHLPDACSCTFERMEDRATRAEERLAVCSKLLDALDNCHAVELGTPELKVAWINATTALGRSYSLSRAAGEDMVEGGPIPTAEFPRWEWKTPFWVSHQIIKAENPCETTNKSAPDAVDHDQASSSISKPEFTTEQPSSNASTESDAREPDEKRSAPIDQGPSEACPHENTRHDACSNDWYCHDCKSIYRVGGEDITPIPLAVYQAQRTKEATVPPEEPPLEAGIGTPWWPQRTNEALVDRPVLFQGHVYKVTSVENTPSGPMLAARSPTQGFLSTHLSQVKVLEPCTDSAEPDDCCGAPLLIGCMRYPGHDGEHYADASWTGNMNVSPRPEPARKDLVVWADEISPFTGAQVKDLLEENERLRARTETPVVQEDDFWRRQCDAREQIGYLRGRQEATSELANEALSARTDARVKR